MSITHPSPRRSRPSQYPPTPTPASTASRNDASETAFCSAAGNYDRCQHASSDRLCVFDHTRVRRSTCRQLFHDSVTDQSSHQLPPLTPPWPPNNRQRLEQHAHGDTAQDDNGIALTSRCFHRCQPGNHTAVKRPVVVSQTVPQHTPATFQLSTAKLPLASSWGSSWQ